MLRRDFAQLPRLILINGHVILAISLAFLLFLYLRDSNKRVKTHLKKQLGVTKLQIKQAKARFERLDLALKSQADPQYIEMVLKTKLGVKRDEEEVVVFTRDFKE